MFHVMFQQASSYDVAVLCKTEALHHDAIIKHYIDPMKQLGCKASFIGFSLEYNGSKKVTAAYAKEYLTQELLPELRELGVKVLYCTDGNYFKVLTKNTKAEPFFGYVVPCAIPGYEDMQVVLSGNHRALFANDALQPKIDLANQTLVNHLKGTYKEIGTDIVKFEKLIPCDAYEIGMELAKLHQYPVLTCDIEAFSLRHTKAGIGTISFAWNQHEGIAIDIEHVAARMGFRNTANSRRAKSLLKGFFETYKGKLIFHNCTYDIKVLIYELWMRNLLDTEGLLQGLSVMTRDFEDTKIISYLATNSCAGNHLSLKEQAHEFAGNYAQSEINDITQIGSRSLLHYNLVDCLSTWYVYNKNTPIMVNDEQDKIYEEIFKPALRNIIQMELTGMPLNMERVIEVDKILKGIIDENYKVLADSKIMQDFNDFMKDKIAVKKNAKYKKKRVTADDIEYTFNPNSNDQLIALIHEFIGYDVYATTDSGQPAVGGDELKGHIGRSDNPEIQSILKAIFKIKEGDKIRNTFIAKFLEADEGPDGWHYLFGSFNLGGTKSGRLSSSDPNLQNLPSGSTYGKLVKSCFQAPPGWLFVGLDYASLEDRINTLLTKDPNKLKVYTDGFDGHSYRAVSYWPSEFPHIDITDPKSVNSLQAVKGSKEDKIRSKSKAPTFALTYQGTWKTLVSNCGFHPEEAKEIEMRYHQLYEVSDKWVQAKLDQAAVDGYVTLAFGLRLRTPILAKTILGNSYTPYQAAAEGRTAGNAVSGQSYGLLNTRAGFELQHRVLNSKYRLDIKPCAHIHDAQYLLVRDSIESVEWLNKNIVECVEWQELPEIQHDEVKLTGDLGIFWPSWANEITLPHNATPEKIVEVANEGKQLYLNPPEK